MRQVSEPELDNTLTDLLGILSKKDALTIFLLAKDGLKAEADTPQNIGLTRKQYYTRLKQLVDNQLMDKRGDMYVHTTLGSYVYQNHIVELMKQVKNVEQMKMIDTLKQAKQFSDDEIQHFVQKITGTSIATTMNCRIIWSWEDMVSTILERINICESEILLASRFTNELIINAMIRKADVGLDVKVVADTDLVKGFIRNASGRLRIVDKNSLERLNVVGNPWYPAGHVKRKYTDVPFSFITFDSRECCIEIVDVHNQGKFTSCLWVKDEQLSQELRTQFNTLWQLASDDLTRLLEITLTDNKNSH